LSAGKDDKSSAGGSHWPRAEKSSPLHDNIIKIGRSDVIKFSDKKLPFLPRVLKRFRKASGWGFLLWVIFEEPFERKRW